jgi:hypothetical protein
MKSRFLVGALVVLVLSMMACGEGQKVGSEKILDFEEQENAERLGQRQSPSPEPSPAAGEGEKGALGQRTPSPAAAPPPAEEKFFDVTLIAASPYYEPGNQLAMPTGLTLRVTNKDTTPERATRSFTAEDGSFDSGQLRPGQVWTMKFTKGGFWRIVDKAAPFIFAELEVK